MIQIYLTAALLLFAPLARGSVQGWAVGVIFLVALIIMFFSLYWKQSFFIFASTALDKPIAALLVLSAGSFIFSIHHYTSSIAISQLVSYLVVYYVVSQIVRKHFVLLFFVYWLISISTLLCIIGLLKLAGLTPFYWWNFLASAHPKFWLTATFGNHNHLAGWLEMSFPLLFCLIIFGCQKKWLIIQMLVLGLQGACLLLTFSRGGWVGATASIIFIAGWLFFAEYKKKGQIILYYGLAAVALSFAVLAASPLIDRINTVVAGGVETQGFADRLLIWSGTMNMILENWLTGTGPGTYSLAFPRYQPPGFSHRYYMAHNDYLQFTAEFGIGIIILIVWMLAVLYHKGLRDMRLSDKFNQAVFLGSLAGITALLVHSMVDFNLHIPSNALLFSVIAAFVVRDSKVNAERDSKK
ncbi:MAG: hypothetical protein D3918_14625 [Candidatus Electrothrix sp. AX2]|nr:hypothetical protein [Candidatus Electrothrix gigas]